MLPEGITPTIWNVGGLSIELIEYGIGNPLLLLHPEIGIEPQDKAIDLLARRFHVLAPVHPGFGHSELDESITSITDLAFFYADFIRQRQLENVTLVGIGLGGWIAAELATLSTDPFDRIVLANSLGVKFGTPETRDIADIFAVTRPELAKLAYHDETLAPLDFPDMEDDALYVIARNWEATARVGWSPYMHNPKLLHRLKRIDIPALVLWGASDRIVDVEYGRSLSVALNAEFQIIDAAGHYPHLEQPEQFANAILNFANPAAPVSR